MVAKQYMFLALCMSLWITVSEINCVFAFLYMYYVGWIVPYFNYFNSSNQASQSVAILLVQYNIRHIYF